MEYLGLSGLWKGFQGFTLSDDTILGLIALGVAVLAILAFNWLSKR